MTPRQSSEQRGESRSTKLPVQSVEWGVVDEGPIVHLAALNERAVLAAATQGGDADAGARNARTASTHATQPDPAPADEDAERSGSGSARCPTCGHLRNVVTGSEGTSYNPPTGMEP